jgi:GT2 family glycosyltransferase
MRGTRTVCVGVPVWRGADHAPETLESLLRQRGVGLTIVVSVDGADEGSVAACRPFLADPRVSLVVQPRRLGWVGNSSAVLTAAAAGSADYACLQPHDDLLDDEYLAVLLAAAEANPEAAVVYSDVQSFGTHDNVIRQPTVAGSPFERQIDVMRHHYAAISYRGLMRVSALRSILPMAGNPCDDFAADTVWLARQALVGDLVRVPHALYRKRYHRSNTHSQWPTWPRERRMMAWSRHCLDMLATALKASRTASERRRLYKAAHTRLLRPRNWTPYRSDLVAMSPRAQADMRSSFDALAASRADIGPPPETLFRTGLRAVSGLHGILTGRKLRHHPGAERQ